MFLNLAGNHLTGSIPSEVGNLLRLQRFRANVNELTGTIPTEVGQLTELQLFSVGRNQLTGNIPSEFGMMSAMGSINISQNKLFGPIPPEIGDIPSLVDLNLQDNALTGQVPTEFGNLVTLQTLEIGSNSFSGEVPWQVCELGGVTELQADCHLMQCDCCTTCTATESPTRAPSTPSPTVAATPAPTTSPTASPTGSPTKAPTASPTTCTTFIEWVPDCIDAGEDLVVRFQNCDPQFGDWIGIYDKNADPANLGTPYLWAWACGSQNCRGSPRTNTVTLAADEVDAQGGTWPLEKADYYAYFIRNSGNPAVAFAETQDKRKIDRNKC